MNHHVDVSVERDPSHNGILLLRQNMRPGDPVHRDWIDVAFERVPDLLARIKEATGLPEEPRPPIWYLASPYSHEDGLIRARRHRQVCEAAARLFERGIYTYSPIAHTVAINELGGLPGMRFEFWRAFDLGMVDRLTGLMVLILPGWRESVGLQAEIAHARATGKPVLWAEPEMHIAYLRVVGVQIHEDEPVAEEGDEPDELRPCLASMGVHDCVRPLGHDGPHACDEECDAPDHLHETEAVEA